MSVIVDSTSGRFAVSGTQATATWTINPSLANSNFVAQIQIFILDNTVSVTNCNIGGTAGTLITGTDSTNTVTFARSFIYQVINPPTGSQTVTINVSATAIIIGGVTVAANVDQVTGCNNGKFVNAGVVNSINCPMTSAAGDLTSTAAESVSGPAGGITTNKTLEWGGTITPATQGGDAGDNTANPTHTWTGAGTTDWLVVGANFIQLSAGATPAQLVPAVNQLSSQPWYSTYV